MGQNNYTFKLIGDIKLLTKYDFVAPNNNLTAIIVHLIFKIIIGHTKDTFFLLIACGFSMFKIFHSAKNGVRESATLSLKYWRH